MKKSKYLRGTKNEAHRFRLLSLIVSISLIAGCMGLAGCGSTPQENPDQPEETMKVPDIVNMTKDDATRVITADGFKVGTVKEEHSETIPAGNVISQDPKPGTEATSGSSLNLVVSKGSDKPAEQVSVPNLNGMTQTQAEQALLQAKLVPMPGDPEYAQGIDPGKVFKQSIAAGTSVTANSSVGFVTALGNETVTVPNVSGMTKDNAVSTLVGAGFGVDVHEEYNSSVPAGNVISQNPYAKVTCLKGTTIFLTISSGPIPAGKVKVPELSTLSLQQAIRICNSAGLVLEPSGSDLNGTIVSQSPEAGTMVEKGTTVSAQFEPVYLDS